MEYAFVLSDLFEKPNTYMYPPFGGAAFLQAWRRQRQEALEQLVPFLDNGHDDFFKKTEPAAILACLRQTAPSAIEARNGCESAPADTAEALTALYQNPEATFTERHQPLVDGLIRRFEVHKKLPQKLIAPHFPLNRAPLLSGEAYALLAGILAWRQARVSSPRELNCLLKINDLLTSQPLQAPSMKNMRPLHFEALAFSLAVELGTVSELLGGSL
jgi:hypothetical protein